MPKKQNHESFGAYESKEHRDRCATAGLMISRSLEMPYALPRELFERVRGMESALKIIYAWVANDHASGEPRIKAMRDIKQLAMKAIGRSKETDEDDEPQLQYMTEPELRHHLDHQLRFIESCQTIDTIGSMLIIFGADGIAQYGATIDPQGTPASLRELADRIEANQTVKR